MFSFPPAAPGLSTGRICTMGKCLERPPQEDASSHSGHVGFWIDLWFLTMVFRGLDGNAFLSKKLWNLCTKFVASFLVQTLNFWYTLFSVSKTHKRKPVSLRYVVQYAVIPNECPGSGFGAPGTGNRANWGYWLGRFPVVRYSWKRGGGLVGGPVRFIFWYGPPVVRRVSLSDISNMYRGKGGETGSFGSFPVFSYCVPKIFGVKTPETVDTQGFSKIPVPNVPKNFWNKIKFGTAFLLIYQRFPILCTKCTKNI